MSFKLEKKIIYYIIIIMITVFLCVYRYIKNNKLNLNLVKINSKNNNVFSQQSNLVIIIVYRLSGKINYKLQADKVEKKSQQEIISFNNFKITVFNDRNIPIWEIKSNQAKLFENRKLYLYGNVSFKNTDNFLYINKITTSNALLDLKNKNLISNSKVVLSGNNFKITSMKMRANLQKKIIRLVKKVNTIYEISKDS